MPNKKQIFTKYKINSGIIIQKIGDKTTFFEGENSVLMTLNETGTLIFKYIKNGWDIHEISLKIIEKYNTSRKKAEEDVEEFIKELLEKKVISKN